MRVKAGWLIVGAIVLAGCSPPGPPPPVMGPGIWSGIGWLILVAFAVGFYFLVRKETRRPPRERDHLAETVNDIHERLKRLEERLDTKDRKGAPLKKDI